MDRRQTIPRRRSRWPAVALSTAAHAGLLAALLLAVAPAAPPRIVPDIVPFELVPPPKAEPPPETPQPSDAPAAPAPAASTSPIRPPVLPAPPEVQPLVAPVAEAPKPATTLGAAELAGARTAGVGGAGSGVGSGGTGAGAGCDMVERLEGALRRDRRVRAAVAQAGAAPGHALLVWDGDWVTSQGEAGKGLAGLRQAIAWEVGFAPEACRNEPMRGLVLISLDEGRVALGAGAWRWTDLLGRGRG